MKVFEIHGKLSITDDLSHQDMLEKFYIMLKEWDMYFSGETKDITDKINYIR